MANQGLWVANLEGTVNRLNALLCQYDIDANKDSVLGDIGRLFIASDTYEVYRDSGTAWVTVMDLDPAVSVAGLRTLGTGATEAAAGNHTH